MGEGVAGIKEMLRARPPAQESVAGVDQTHTHTQAPLWSRVPHSMVLA